MASRRLPVPPRLRRTRRPATCPSPSCGSSHDRHTPVFSRAAVAAPHALASEAGRAVLAEGGNAIEAMVAMAATIAVVYPHMNAHRRRRLLAGARARRQGARHRGLRPGRRARHHRALPRQGLRGDSVARARRGADRRRAPSAAGRLALELSRRRSAGACRSRDLLADAIRHARDGYAGLALGGAHRAQRGRRAEARARLRRRPSWSDGKTPDGRRAAASPRRWARRWSSSPMPGSTTSTAATSAARSPPTSSGIGAPVTRADLERLPGAAASQPLSIAPPGRDRSTTSRRRRRGWPRCIILGIFERLGVDAGRELRAHPRPGRGDQARLPRSATAIVTDPARLRRDPACFLTPERARPRGRARSP